jgi:hypothetical protein
LEVEEKSLKSEAVDMVVALTLESPVKVMVPLQSSHKIQENQEFTLTKLLSLLEVMAMGLRELLVVTDVDDVNIADYKRVIQVTKKIAESPTTVDTIF